MAFCFTFKSVIHLEMRQTDFFTLFFFFKIGLAILDLFSFCIYPKIFYVYKISSQHFNKNYIESVYLYYIDVERIGSLLCLAFQSMNSLHFSIYFYLFLKKRFYLFIFQRGGREGEREGEKHQCVVASYTPPPEDLAHNPGMCPDWESNQQTFGSQAYAQSTELHQPGISILLISLIGIL